MILKSDLQKHLLDEDGLGQIAALYNCTASNVSYWIKKYGLRKYEAPRSLDPLTQWIYEHCLTMDTTRLNNSCERFEWWERRGYLDQFEQIMKQTQEFGPAKVSERLYAVTHGLNAPPKCLHCQQASCTFKCYRNGYHTYCSKQCSTQSTERNKKIKKSRTDVMMRQIVEKTKVTTLNKHGKEFYYQTDEFKGKARATKNERYGDEKYNNQRKSQRTCMERYGVPYPGQSDIVKQKNTQAAIDRRPELGNPIWLRRENQKKSIAQIASELKMSYRGLRLWYLKHNITMNFFAPDYSKLQQTLIDFIISLNLNTTIQINDRNVIGPKEIDIYLPEYRLGIELNGMYWHAGNKHRHIEKYRRTQALGITLLQIWDHEWIHNQPIISSIIRSRLSKNIRSVYARRCKVREISSTNYHDFLEQTHLKGSHPASMRYGLFFDGELLSVMGVSKSRYSSKYTHELVRFSTKLHTTVIGGFSKLFSHIMSTHLNISSVQTFSDNRLFSGASYMKSGFVLSHYTPPGYVYWKQNVIYDRVQFQKHKLAASLAQYDPALSESENMSANGYLQVWDCGQSVFSYQRKDV